MRTLVLCLAGLLAAASPLACKHAPEPGEPAAAPAAITSTSTAPALAAAQTESAPAADTCTTDADCGYTHVAEGACCPMLCAPRVVSKARAEALQKAIATCHGGQQCPVPMCRPPKVREVAACEQGRCVGKKTPIPE